MLMVLVFVLAVAVVFSDTAIGRTFRESWSRLRIPRPTRGQLAVALVLIVFATTLIAVLKSDGLALAARAAPDGMAWFAAFDVATYLDVVTLAALAALTLRLRVVWVFIRRATSWCARVVRAVRSRRSARACRRPRADSPKSDDEDGWLHAPALA